MGSLHTIELISHGIIANHRTDFSRDHYTPLNWFLMGSLHTIELNSHGIIAHHWTEFSWDHCTPLNWILMGSLHAIELISNRFWPNTSTHLNYEEKLHNESERKRSNINTLHVVKCLNETEKDRGRYRERVQTKANTRSEKKRQI